MRQKAWTVLSLGLVLAGCATERAHGVTDKEVVIGISGPLSGPAAAWSAIAEGAQAWAAHVSAQGGVHGRRIRVVLKDDGYVPGRAVANLTEMEGSVFAVVATPLGTAVANANKDLVAEAGLPVIWPFANPRVWARQPREKLERVFVVYPDYEHEGAFLAGEARKRAAAKRVAVFYQNDDYGRDGLAGVRRGLGTVGTLVAEVPYELQDRDMSIHALKIQDAGADTVILYSTTTHGANLVREMAKVGYRPALFASFPLGDQLVMFRLLGDLWEGAYFTVYGPAAGEPAANRVVDVLGKENPALKGRELFAVYGAAAMALAVEGMRRAGPDLTREAFVRAMETIKDWKPADLEMSVTFGPGRRHGLNGVRLLRAGRAADNSYEVVTGFQGFPPLF